MSTEEPHKIVDKADVADAANETDIDREKNAAVQDYATSKEAHKTSGDLEMDVKVYSPFKDYYDGPAFSISAENTTGPFDILPQHHNFITLLSPCDVMIRTVGKGDQKIRIGGGIMHVKADKVIVFLDV
jgi:hypothetical protein